MVEQSTELKRAKKKVDNLESELNKAKLALAVIDHLKADLAAPKQAQDASYKAATQAQSEVVTIGVQSNKALRDLVEIQVVSCGPI